jgi:hypothetical protein
MTGEGGAKKGQVSRGEGWVLPSWGDWVRDGVVARMRDAVRDGVKHWLRGRCDRLG